MEENIRKTTMEVVEMATFLGIGRTQAYKIIHEPDFPAFRIGGKVLVDRERLEQWKEKKMREGI